MSAPTLIVVSGPPGSGKTTLAHAIAPLIPCPAICRDEIKEGMAHAAGPTFEAAPGDPLTVRTVTTFAEVLRVLIEAGVSVIAEAAFQDTLWRQVLEPSSEHAQLRVLHCTTDTAVAWQRSRQRAGQRIAHATGAHVHDLAKWTELYGSFDRVSLPVPSLVVDTTQGYAPALEDVVAFVNGA